MARKRNRKGKVEKELDNLSIGVSAILEQYKIIPKKDKNSIIKKLEKENKRLNKKLDAGGEPSIRFNIARNNIKIKKLNNQTERIPIQYGIAKFNVKPDYLAKIKDKEKYLDNLFNRSMKYKLNKFPAPKNIGEAKQLEGLITQYSKKIRDRTFYDNEVVQNSINKLTNFKNTLTLYEYGDYINFLRMKESRKEQEGTEDFTDEDWEDEWEEETGSSIDAQTYKAIEKPLLVDNWLVGIELNFF